MKKSKKKLRFLLAIAFMTLFGLSIKVTDAKAATVTYDYKDTIFGTRTKEEVVKKYADAQNAGSDTYKNGDPSTYYTTPASITSPYHQGILTDDTLKAMEGMTNFYRYMAGVEPLQESCTQNESLQYQALDRNFKFAHYISDSDKPSDMSDELWKKGFDCTHNILASGYTPSGAVTGWMNEGYNLSQKSWDTLGHRYALIEPEHSNIQFGYCGRIAIGKNSQDKNPDYTEAFSAFPSPGYMPDNLLRPSESAWTLDLNTNKIKASNTSNVVVTVTNLSTNDSYECKTSDKTAQVSSGRVAFVQPSDAVNGKYTANYSVKVTGLTDVATGDEAVVTYEVKFFDVTQTMESYVKSVKPVGFTKLVVYKTMNSTKNLEKAAAVLPNEFEVTAESGYKTKIKVTGHWTLDEANQCYTNHADASSLPSHIKDKNGLLDKITIPYNISTSDYDLYNTLSYSGTAAEGKTISMEVYRTLVSADHSEIYKIIANSDGTYSGQKRFDRYESEEYDADKSAQSPYQASDFYTFGPLKVSDSGEYISVYYYDGGNGYLSTDINTLTIDHQYEDKVVKPTCTEGGYTIHECTNCGYKYTDAKTNALGHDLKKTIVKPTCTEDGYTLEECTRCDYSEKTDKTPKLGHDLKKTIVRPTCTEGGYTLEECTRCDYSDKTDKTSKLGHNYKETIVKPTCTEDGYTLHKCSACGAEYKDTKTEKLGHSYVVQEKKDSTCEKEGYITYQCERCKDSYTKTLEKLPHSYEDTVVKPTCTKDGYTLHKCSVCGAEYKDTETTKLGHSYVVYEKKDPTCQMGGYITYQCERCQERYTKTLEKLPHSYKDTVIKPTCTEAGYTIHECKNCGYKYTDAKTNALGHNTQLKNKIQPTYFATGYTGDTICTRCNSLIKKGTTINKLALGKTTIKAKPAKKQIKLTLKKVIGAYRYEIKVKLGKKTKTYYTTKTSYTLKKLKSKKTYTVTVRTMAVQGKQKVYGKAVSKKIKVK